MVDAESHPRPRRTRHDSAKHYDVERKDLELSEVLDVLQCYVDYGGGINCCVCGKSSLPLLYYGLARVSCLDICEVRSLNRYFRHCGELVIWCNLGDQGKQHALITEHRLLDSDWGAVDVLCKLLWFLFFICTLAEDG